MPNATLLGGAAGIAGVLAGLALSRLIDRLRARRAAVRRLSLHRERTTL